MTNRFEFVIEAINQLLKKRDFRKDKYTFYKKDKDLIALISIQKSKQSTVEKSIFTINVGIFSVLIWEFINEEPQPKTISISNSHWQERIGFLKSSKKDEWWTIDQTTEMQGIIKIILDQILTVALVKIDKFMIKDGLIDYWNEKLIANSIDFNEMIFLSILLKHENRFEELRTLLIRLSLEAERTKNKNYLKYHLSKLNDSNSKELLGRVET